MTKYVRNPSTVLNSLKTVGDSLIAIKNCRIQIPLRYSVIDLAQLSGDIFILGIYAIILDTNEYAVCNIPAMINITPDRIIQTKINDDEYYEFHFDAGSTIIKDLNVVRRDTILFNILNEFIFNGNVPWFMGYEDLGKLFDYTDKFAGSHVGNLYEVNEFIASMIARCQDNRSFYYRLGNDFKKTPTYISLKSVLYAVKGTVNKLAGSYFNEGLVSALVEPSTQVEKIESLLRA